MHFHENKHHTGGEVILTEDKAKFKIRVLLEEKRQKERDIMIGMLSIHQEATIITYISIHTHTKKCCSKN